MSDLSSCWRRWRRVDALRTRWKPMPLVGALIAALAIQSCAMQGLSFVQDDRVEILKPEPNATVRLPLEVHWDANDHDGYFAVFFDRTPMRPGQSLRSIVPENDPCRADRRCPDADWLADRNVYVTAGTTLVVERLPDLRDTDRAKDRHDLTIVLLGADGRRAGESAFGTEFIVEREN